MNSPLAVHTNLGTVAVPLQLYFIPVAVADHLAPPCTTTCSAPAPPPSHPPPPCTCTLHPAPAHPPS